MFTGCQNPSSGFSQFPALYFSPHPPLASPTPSDECPSLCSWQPFESTISRPFPALIVSDPRHLSRLFVFHTPTHVGCSPFADLVSVPTFSSPAPLFSTLLLIFLCLLSVQPVQVGSAPWKRRRFLVPPLYHFCVPCMTLGGGDLGATLFWPLLFFCAPSSSTFPAFPISKPLC